MSAAYETRLESLEAILVHVYDVWEAEYDDDSDEELNGTAREENRTRIKQTFLDTLTQIVSVIRDAEVAHYDALPLLVEKADQILNEASLFASDEIGPYEGTYVPSFAHLSDGGFMMDTSQDGKFSYGFVTQMLPFMRQLYREFRKSHVQLFFLFLLMDIVCAGTEVVRNPDEILLELPKPWKKTARPHSLSTPCARFKEPLTAWEVTNANEHATSVLQARCEIGSEDIHNPIDMALSSNGNVLALSSMGGWKSRTPYLWYYLPNHESDHGSLKKHSIKADLLSSLDRIFLDERRNLMFVADYNRIKSYRYNLPSVANRIAKAKRVHTMNSSNYTGPITLLGSDRFLRAGNGSVAIWELDALQTHGETGKDIIGEKIDMDTWRDDPEDIEPSTGSALSTTIRLEGCKSARDEDGPEIKNWHQHPSNANILLCGMDTKSSNNFCHAYDFQAEGKIVTRYLGHGGAVEGFSTSPSSNAHVFLTRCSDGHARLYDSRHPLPTMTIACSRDLEPIEAAVIAEPDGIPFVFTATARCEDIKVWDVRGQAHVYELATGNNIVNAMAWDAASNSLYAATSCPYIDRNGHHTDYRSAKIPVSSSNQEFGDEGTEQEQARFEESEGRCWPNRAYHAEDHFGHVFDAGDHRLYKFSFRTYPDMAMLPYYGGATISGSGFESFGW